MAHCFADAQSPTHRLRLARRDDFSDRACIRPHSPSTVIALQVSRRASAHGIKREAGASPFGTIKPALPPQRYACLKEQRYTTVHMHGKVMYPGRNSTRESVDRPER